MKIIAFEGLDKAGKATLSHHLANYLEAKDFTVGLMDFHRYSTPTGQLIKKFLYGEYDVPQDAIELIMAADKVAALQDFKMLEQEGYDYLILDRYKLSQYVYSMANNYDADRAHALWEMIPNPDYTFYVDVTPETSMKRQGKHGINDRYESDHALLTRVRDGYLDFVEDANIFILDGEQPLEEIQAQLIIQVKERMAL